MKKIIILGILILTSVLTQIIIFIPWWSFLIPIFLLGVVLPLEKLKVRTFLLGFTAGLLVWTLSTFFFEIMYKGAILTKLVKVNSVMYYILYGFIGFIGGLLTGLAFYSGFLFKNRNKASRLELSGNESNTPPLTV